MLSVANVREKFNVTNMRKMTERTAALSSLSSDSCLCVCVCVEIDEDKISEQCV